MIVPPTDDEIPTYPDSLGLQFWLLHNARAAHEALEADDYGTASIALSPIVIAADRSEDREVRATARGLLAQLLPSIEAYNRRHTR